MAVPLPNQIPHTKQLTLPDVPEKSVARRTSPETQSQKENSVSSGPGHRSSKPAKTRSNGNSATVPAHTISEGAEGKDPYVCSCGDSFVSEEDSYRHVKAHKPVFVRPKHLNDRPLRGHEGLEALKKSLEGERKRPQNNRRQPRRTK